MNKVILFFACGLLFHCATNTPHSQMAEESVERYRDTFEKHIDLEDELRFVLFNLERLPEDPFLKKRHQQLKIELLELEEQLTLFSQDKRQVFQQWENRIVEKRIQNKENESFESDAEKRIKEQKKKVKDALNFME